MTPGAPSLRSRPAPAGAPLGRTPRKLVAFIPAPPVFSRPAVQKGLRPVGVLCGPIKGEVERAPNRQAHKLGPHPILRRRDALEVSRAPVVDVDEKLFHMEYDIVAARRTRPNVPRAVAVGSRLFRVLDAVKPWPLRRLERLPRREADRPR